VAKKNFELKIFTGNAHRQLAQDIAAKLDIKIGNALVGHFPDGEIDVKVNEDVRGCDVFLVQPSCPPVNENLMELLILIDCMKRASVGRITAVIPYFGYARKDRKDEGRVPITAKLVANLLTKAGLDRVVTVDLHASQIQGFFDIPVDHLFASPVISQHFLTLQIPDLVVVSPDVGSIKMARAYAKRLSGDLAVVDKRRIGPDEVEVNAVIGDVEGKNVILIDDIISTAGTITNAARLVKSKGALDVYIAATHPILCGQAWDKLQKAPVKSVVVTDSIPLKGNADRSAIHVLSLAGLLAEAIHRIHDNESVSSLFD
jgi:ribose-phosphate pyrophosphokinase